MSSSRSGDRVGTGGGYSGATHLEEGVWCRTPVPEGAAGESHPVTRGGSGDFREVAFMSPTLHERDDADEPEIAVPVMDWMGSACNARGGASFRSTFFGGSPSSRRTSSISSSTARGDVAAQRGLGAILLGLLHSANVNASVAVAPHLPISTAARPHAPRQPPRAAPVTGP